MIFEEIIYVDKVIFEESWVQKIMNVKEYNVDIFVIGDDWKGDFFKDYCEVVYLPCIEGILTIKIKDN